MDLRIFIEPQQGADYDDQLRVARTAEDAGYNAFFRSDHFLAMGGVSGEPGPTDSWLTLAGLARETSTIRLGTLVTSATFRRPGPLAIAVAQVDRMSGGRVELGLGAGWFEPEHAAYGVPFPGVAERFDRLTEQLEIITGLWRTLPGERFDHSGVHYTVTDSPALPKPVQQPAPPVIVGGTGKQRTPMLAARFAAEVNVAFNSIETTAAAFERAAAACAEIGRKPADLVRSAAQPIAVGRTDEEVARRALTIGKPVDELKADGVAGTPAEVVDRLGQWHERTGVTRFYLQLLDLADLDQIDLIAAEVAPHLP
ncbi:MAG TPA: LLM class F420-dependent oxidoreductase [Pseudonocardia sp.]|nr:LLM class F420-dependent oxidoreductase [Pseudonocardia sp.]